MHSSGRAKFAPRRVLACEYTDNSVLPLLLANEGLFYPFPIGKSKTKQLTISEQAMAGGAGMILTPSTIMPMVSLGFLSPDGKCYAFDSRANGYGRGEGVGIVVLKRLSDAIRDNDTIRGVIRGTATNQDGRTSGITLPSSEAQVINIRKAYRDAGLDFSKTMFVECHGTGTQAGDPRELKAISDSFCNERDTNNPIMVGSAKTNIGHLEGSAGVAGVIKAVMTIENGKIPKHLNFESWNPKLWGTAFRRCCAWRGDSARCYRIWNGWRFTTAISTGGTARRPLCGT
jgi:hypothetical protein